MTNRLRGLGAAIAACALALVLAACGGGTPTADDHGMTAEEHAAWLAEQSQSGQSGGSEASGQGGGHGGHGGSTGALELWAVQSDLFPSYVVTEGGGRILYRNDRDSSQPPASTCVDQGCTSVWEPLLVPAGQVVGLGVDQSKIGTVSRPDGSQQVTLSGWPLYTHAGENGGQATTASGADGVWFAIAPTGEKAVPAAG
jgi:predicted lipoprotein with Yx(FWY)xxD motif